MKRISHAPEYQSLHAGNCTQNQPVFSHLKDNLASVINSVKTFSTGCHTQKDHNIRKVCERLIALTCMTPECYLTPEIKACAAEIGFVLPNQIEPVSAENGQATASIGKLSALSTSSLSAQAAYNMLRQQQDKYLSAGYEFSQESADTIQMVLAMAEQGFCLARDHSSRYGDKYIVTTKSAENTPDNALSITPEQRQILHSAACRMNLALTLQLKVVNYNNESIISNTGGATLSEENLSNLSRQLFYPDFNNISIAT